MLRHGWPRIAIPDALTAQVRLLNFFPDRSLQKEDGVRYCPCLPVLLVARAPVRGIEHGALFDVSVAERGRNAATVASTRWDRGPRKAPQGSSPTPEPAVKITVTNRSSHAFRIKDGRLVSSEHRWHQKRLRAAFIYS